MIGLIEIDFVDNLDIVEGAFVFSHECGNEHFESCIEGMIGMIVVDFSSEIGNHKKVGAIQDGGFETMTSGCPKEEFQTSSFWTANRFQVTVTIDGFLNKKE